VRLAGGGAGQQNVGGGTQKGIIVGGANQTDASHAATDRVGDEFAGCIERLGVFAARTYAPATASSRMAGAGAGLTDND